MIMVHVGMVKIYAEVANSSISDIEDSVTGYDVNNEWNETSGLYEKEFLELDYDPKLPMNIFLFIVRGVLMIFFGVLGFIGNIVSIIIFSRPEMKSSTCCILLGISIYDAMFDVLAIIFAGIPSIYPFMGTTFKLYYIYIPKLEPYLHVLLEIAFTSSLYLTVAVSFERFMAVFYPLRVKSVCTRKRAKVATSVITAFSVLFNIPKFWEIDTTEMDYAERNMTLYYTEILSYSDVYTEWIEIFVDAFPFLTCLVLNILIFWQSKIINAERKKKLNVNQISDINTTKILVFIVQGFLFCNILKLIFYFVDFEENWTIDGLHWFLRVFNNFLNFVIYSTLWKSYQNILVLLISPACILCRKAHGTEQKIYVSEVSHL